MEIINAGDEKVGQWWIGSELVCLKCGRKVKLQKGDELHPFWIHQREYGLVVVRCECCGGEMRHGKPATKMLDEWTEANKEKEKL